MVAARLGSVTGLLIAATGIGFSPVVFQGPLPVPPPRVLNQGVPPGQFVTSIEVSPIDGMPIMVRETHDPMPILDDSAAETMPIRIMPLPPDWR
jgi:hypothetical protein